MRDQVLDDLDAFRDGRAEMRDALRKVILESIIRTHVVLDQFLEETFS